MAAFQLTASKPAHEAGPWQAPRTPQEGRALAQKLAAQLENAEPDTIIRTAFAAFPHLAVATQFGVEGCSLLHRVAQIAPKSYIFCINTGLLFLETLQLASRLERRLGIRVEKITPQQSVAEQAVHHGPNLWERDPDVCCLLRKVQPMQQALQGRPAWMTAIRRGQSQSRSDVPVVQWDERFNLLKFAPLVRESAADVEAYIARHDVPTNPLRLLGYASVGCFTCTRPTKPGEDPRAGRWWRAPQKSECGLHTLPRK